MYLPKLIDNKRKTFSDILREAAKKHKHLSIAVGFWDLPGMAEIMEEIKDYESVRLIIGREPSSSRFQKYLQKDDEFPDIDIKEDLQDGGQNYKEKDAEQYRKTGALISKMIEEKRLAVKVFRKPFMHAKIFVFGNFDSAHPIGFIGSSNFTKNGLTAVENGGNIELNTPEDTPHIVKYPVSQKHEYGHLSWFEDMWNDEDAVEWTLTFRNIIEISPFGDKTFGHYDVYIKSLMEVFPDELVPPEEIDISIKDVLYSFQRRNAGILINKLEKIGLAMLSDSVGLGKTITAGAVMKHYINKDERRIVVIAPASLKQQWINELSEKIGLLEQDFKIISQQDLGAIRQFIDFNDQPWMKNNPVNLFVIDEAHNLRHSGGERYALILKLLQQSEKSKVLLLTATPLNNSLMDLVHQIRLASKGNIRSVNVFYKGQSQDFFKVLEIIQSEIKRHNKEGKKYDYESIENIIHQGLIHYLVRLTRQGVEAEGGIINSQGEKKTFPKSRISPISHDYSDEIKKFVFNGIEKKLKIFEKTDPRALNLELMSEFTQITSHPLDFIPECLKDQDYLKNHFGLDEKEIKKLKIKDSRLIIEPQENVAANILQIFFLLGLVPYRPDIYKREFYAKPMKEIKLKLNEEQSRRLQSQAAIHNMIHITWLKRFESCAASLLESLKNYLGRMDLFEKYLDKGYILNLNEIYAVEDEYGDDLEAAFDDYEKHIRSIEKALTTGGQAEEIESKGVKKIEADDKVYNIEAMRRDIERDRQIAGFLIELLDEIKKPENNSKLKSLAQDIKETLKNGGYGKKVIVFTFFADTVKYLQENIHCLLSDISDFKERAAFVSGKGAQMKDLSNRFSPKSKKYQLKDGEKEIDFLFSTDVLSEGQNLQDAAYLINYDLHWNPVRMIQRNGRINRLGSDFEEIRIANMKPEKNIELYLKLVFRLENKIETIKETIGLDQGVLNEDINPIDFIDEYYKENALISEQDESPFLAQNDVHIVELRRFLSNNSKEEIERILSIPLGKWNYLPNDRQHEKALALMRAEGETAITKKPISDALFMEVETFGRFQTDYIETHKALDILKTDEKDNEKQADKISINREMVFARAYTQAKTQAENSDKPHELKPKQKETISKLQNYFEDEILLEVIQKGISKIDNEKELEKILLKVDKALKKNIPIPEQLLKDFKKLLEVLKKSMAEPKIIETIKGVLFYAPH